jgi:hypothetical protein
VWWSKEINGNGKEVRERRDTLSSKTRDTKGTAVLGGHTISMSQGHQQVRKNTRSPKRSIIFSLKRQKRVQTSTLQIQAPVMNGWDVFQNFFCKPLYIKSYLLQWKSQVSWMPKSKIHVRWPLLQRTEIPHKRSETDRLYSSKICLNLKLVRSGKALSSTQPAGKCNKYVRLAFHNAFHTGHLSHSGL